MKNVIVDFGKMVFIVEGIEYSAIEFIESMPEYSCKAEADCYQHECFIVGVRYLLENI